MNSKIEYEVKSSGYGRRSRWISEYKDATLARALRGLQDYYDAMAAMYGSAASSLRTGREKEAPDAVSPR